MFNEGSASVEYERHLLGTLERVLSVPPFFHSLGQRFASSKQTLRVEIKFQLPSKNIAQLLDSAA